jgi:hypothetical protein
MVSVLMSALWNEYPAKNSFFGCSTGVCAARTEALKTIRKVAIVNFDIQGFSRGLSIWLLTARRCRGEIGNHANVQLDE